MSEPDDLAADRALVRRWRDGVHDLDEAELFDLGHDLADRLAARLDEVASLRAENARLRGAEGWRRG